MIKLVIIFTVFFFAIFLGLNAVRGMSGAEKWQLTKVIGYAILCAIITILVLGAMVTLF
jgi:hypothetical protein